MIKRTGLFITIILFGQWLRAQPCHCNEQFVWLKKTFEENDAGFVSTLEKKGKESYELHNHLIAQKASSITDAAECAEILNSWLQFFRKNHIGLFLTSSETADKSTVTPGKTFNSISEKKLQQLRASVEENPITSLSGIWKTGGYSILFQEEKEYFVGYIIQSENPDWKAGDVKLYLSKKMNEGVYYLGDHSPQPFHHVVYEANKYLTLDQITLVKQLPEVHLSPMEELTYQSKYADAPFAFQIDAETVYLKFPSFGLDQKEQLETLVSQWDQRILQSKNLIIDIRNNGGGSDRTYASVLPYIYTHPIYRNLVEFYSSDANNNTWIELLKNPELSEEERTLFTDFVHRLEANKGGFEKIFAGTTSVIQFDQAQSHPQRVALVIN